MTKRTKEMRHLRKTTRQIKIDEMFDRGVETKIVTNIMSGKLVRIPVDTPMCCDPSSETYWSM